MNPALRPALVLVLAAAASCLLPGRSRAADATAHPGSFADNPIVYFVVTDRFLDGNPANDTSYEIGRAHV